MVTSCTFCRIVRHEQPAHVVLDNELFVAFLDHRPLFPGHCLLVPRAHHETLADLPPALEAPLFATTRVLSEAVERAFGADGSFVAINNRVSQSVPHLHVHVVPRRFHDGLRGFFWPRHRYKDEQDAVAARDALAHAIAGRERPVHTFEEGVSENSGPK